MEEAKCPFMSSPSCTEEIPGEQPTKAEFFAGGITCNKRVNIGSSSCCSRVVQIRGRNKHCEDGSHVIYTLERNYFVIEFAFQAKYETSSCDPYTVKLIDFNNSKVLASKKEWPCTKAKIQWEGVLEKHSVLIIEVHSIRNVICNFKLCGSVDVNQDQYDQRVELDKTTAFDINLNVQYIPARPPQPAYPTPTLKDQWPNFGDVFPWGSINIPWKAGQVPIPNGPPFPNGNWYDKFQSIQYSVFFYLGVDMFTVEPQSPTITIFIKNFLDRGYKNYLKKVYMFALRCENMQYYAEKIDTMLNEAYSAFTVSRLPVVSSFKNILIKFFLAMHVGYDEYPDYVIEYFKGFIDVVGFGDPLRVGRYEIMLRGNELAPLVQAYFLKRNVAVIAAEDKTSFMYWWHLAGLPSESLLIESIHNIVAFSQYVNVLYKVIADKLWWKRAQCNLITFVPPVAPATSSVVIKPLEWWYPLSPIPVYVPAAGVGPVNFFDKMSAAGTETEKIKVAFEVFRLMNTNTNAFSKLMPVSDTSVKVQARHIWQLIMISNYPAGPLPSQALNFFRYGSLSYPGIDIDFNCPTSPPLPPLQNINPETYFEESVVDGTSGDGDGTVLDKAKPDLIPVLPTPVYTPMGLGYRRCAGEILNYFFTVKLLKKFENLEWEVREINPSLYPTAESYFKAGLYETIAPFFAVPDNVYAIPPPGTSPACPV